MGNGFILVTPVWGTLYTDIFLSVGLPSLLAQRNLPAMKTPLVYNIYTTPEDATRLQENLFFKKLKSLMEVVILLTEIQLIL